MAALGYRTFNELIGQSQCLDKERAIDHWKARGLDFENLFHKPERAGVASPSTTASARTTAWTRCSTTS